MSIIPFTEKQIRKKNWNMFDFRSDPESDPDPHQDEVDLKHCIMLNLCLMLS